jgi:LDH2 family malate/lactate/ureidoglycolate dehydrogenase
MARTASGKDILEKAKDCLSKAKTAEELRQAQTVVLPLEYGFSIKQTAAITGISVRWADRCELRARKDRAPQFTFFSHSRQIRKPLTNYFPEHHSLKQ